MSSATAQRAASIARQNGARWESYIRKECYALEKAGRAFVHKNWEAPTIRGSHIKREQSKPDFSGFFTGNGRHVVFEAKANFSETSFPFSQIAGHQIEHLSNAQSSGAVSFVYVLDGIGRKWVIPMWRIIEIRKEGRSSFSYSDHKVYQKQRGETWLDTWNRLEREMGA